MDMFLRWTAISAGPKGVCLRESWLYKDLHGEKTIVSVAYKYEKISQKSLSCVMVIFPAWVTCAFKILTDELHAHKQNLFFSSMRASSPIRASKASCEGCLLWLFALSDFSSLPQRDSLLIGIRASLLHKSLKTDRPHHRDLFVPNLFPNRLNADSSPSASQFFRSKGSNFEDSPLCVSPCTLHKNWPKQILLLPAAQATSSMLLPAQWCNHLS